MAKATEKVSPYNVLTPLRHDKNDYALGDTIDLSDSAAAPLVELGVVSLLPAPEKK